MMWSADDLAEGIADTTIPAPEAQIKGTAAAPVFTTADDFATASLKLIAEKKYEGAEAEDADEAPEPWSRRQLRFGSARPPTSDRSEDLSPPYQIPRV
jgi:hypothetical protein